MNLSLVLQVETKGRYMKIKRVNVTSQVVDYLKKNIESGNWTVGEKIPSENQMTEELGVSRSSIRTALQYLIGLGVLESVHGKGTYLINSRVENWDETENKITSEDCRDIEKYWNQMPADWQWKNVRPRSSPLWRHIWSKCRCSREIGKSL